MQVLEVADCPLLGNFEEICHVLLAGLLLECFRYASFWLSFLNIILGTLIGTAFLLALFF